MMLGQNQQNPSSSIWGVVNGMPLRIPVIGVTGEQGSGKSTWIGTIDPTRTCMIDAEESHVSFNMPFAKTYNLFEEMAQVTKGRVFRPIQAFEWFKNLVENSIQPGEYTVLGLDPASDIEHGMVDWVKDHHAEFGLSKSQIENASGLLWGAVNEFWKSFIGTLSSKVQTFTYTVHMGTVWKGGKPVEGKRKARGKSSLKEVTSLFMTLDRTPSLNAQGQLITPTAPTAYTVDPLGKSRLRHTQIDPQTGMVLGIQPILPPRIAECTPRRIREYIAQPPDWAHLKPEEQYTERKLTDQEVRDREDERQQTELEIETAKLTRAQLLASAGQAQAQQIHPASQPDAQPVQPQTALQQNVQAATQQQAPQQQQPQPQPQQATQAPVVSQSAPVQAQAQPADDAKVRKQQEDTAAQAKAALANPATAGKEVGPGAIPQQPAPQQPVAEPPQQPVATQSQSATDATATSEPTSIDRQSMQQQCMVMFKTHGFNGQSALAKIQEFNPQATTFKHLSDDQLSSLHGFLSDTTAMKHGVENSSQGN